MPTARQSFVNAQDYAAQAAEAADRAYQAARAGGYYTSRQWARVVTLTADAMRAAADAAEWAYTAEECARVADITRDDADYTERMDDAAEDAALRACSYAARASGFEETVTACVTDYAVDAGYRTV
jgi:hypothetical protein